MRYKVIKSNPVNLKADVMICPVEENLKNNHPIIKEFFAKAGEIFEAILHKTNKYPSGKSVFLPGVDFQSDFILVPLTINDNTEKSLNVLRKTYESSLEVATKHKIENLGVPIFDMSQFGFGDDVLFKILIEIFTDTKIKHPRKIIFCCENEEIYKNFNTVLSRIIKIQEIQEQLAPYKDEIVDKVIGVAGPAGIARGELKIKKGTSVKSFLNLLKEPDFKFVQFCFIYLKDKETELTCNISFGSNW